MKKYQKRKCMKQFLQQNEALNRKKESIQKGILYYQKVEKGE